MNLLHRIASLLLITCLFINTNSVSAQYGATKWLQFHEIKASGEKQPDNITNIIQDERGFIWITSLNGLFRYDGFEFKSYRHNPRNPDSLFDNLLTSISIAGKHKLLLGSIHGGVFWFDTLTEKSSKVSTSLNQLKNIQVQSLLLENASQLWIGSYLGLYQVNLKTNQSLHFNHNPLDPYTLPGRLVTSIIRDQANQLWVGTDSGLARLNEKTQEFSQYALSDNNIAPLRINKLYLDNDGSLWVGTDIGLFHIKSAGSIVEKINLHSSPTFITDIKRVHSGDLWITSNKGLFVKKAYGGELTFFSHDSEDPLSPMGNNISTLFENDAHLIFLGSTKGVFQSAPELSNFGRMLHSPFYKSSLSHDFVTGFAETDQSKTFISTIDGIDLYDDKTNQITHEDSKITKVIGSNKIQSFSIDYEHRYWIGTSDGKVSVLNKDFHLIKSFSFDNSNEDTQSDIHFIKSLRDGNIWISTSQQLYKINAKNLNLSKDYLANGFSPLENKTITDIVDDSKGNLWLGTFNGGLFKLDQKTLQFTQFKHLDTEIGSLSNNRVHQLFFDLQDNLWIATANGLNRLNAQQLKEQIPKFTKWFESDGINDSDIRSFILDNSGWMWIATSSGIARMDLKTNTFTKFTESDGLMEQSFNPHVAMMNQQGLLFFGSNRGVTIINPQNFKRNLFRTSVIIDRVKIKQQPWITTDNVPKDIPYNENDLDIKVSYLNYYQPQKIQFYYRINKSKTNLFNNNHTNIISLKNLANGAYHIKFYAKNDDDIQSNKPAVLNFTIAPPPWFSAYAILSYIIILFSVIYFFVRNHNRQLAHEREIAFHLRKNDKLKDEFLAVISHELRTPLTGIIGLAEALIEGSSGVQNKKTLEALNLIVNSSQRLSELVNEILDYKKLSHDSLQIDTKPMDLASLIKVVVTHCQPLIIDKAITITVELEPDLPLVNADPKRLQQILYNLIGNAVKFTLKGQIIVKVLRSDQKINVSIEDTGIGIAKENLEIIFDPFKQIEPSQTRQFTGSGLGLSITKQLVILHQSELEVNSIPGEGTCFSFSLEMSNENESPEQIAPIFNPPLIDSEQIIPTDDNFSESDTVADATMHILVADDEAINRKVICDFLNLAGYQTIQARNGEEALHLAQTQQIDLLILDVMMPKLSGFEVCNQLRHQFSSLQLPILLISARRDSRDIVMGLESGANDYISKPVDKNVLIARTKTLLLLKQISLREQSLESQKTLTYVVNQLSRYFPKALVERLVNEDQVSKIEASRKLITIFFADLVGFTELTDRFEAEVITDLVNQFITEMSALVEQHNGLLNEVLGDGLVILFGTPNEMSKRDQAVEAVNLSISMQHKMQELGERWLSQGLDHNVQLRIGIHQDFATVGNIGSEQLLAYRAIGSGINLASRLQNECEPGKILISYPVYAQTKEMFEFEPLIEMMFKGFNHHHRVCQIDPEKNYEASTFLN